MRTPARDTSTVSPSVPTASADVETNSPNNPATDAPADVLVTPHALADCLARVRAWAPRVHCLVNTVAETFTANVLLAAGVTPSMTGDPDEVPDFVAGADALLVNLGTLDPARRKAALRAVGVATGRRMPWALDPVFVDRSPRRLAFAAALLARGPSLVRANHAEAAALAGVTAGADEAAITEAFCARHGVPLALTGAHDLVAAGGRTLRLANGHPLMARVTATGCALTALVAAFLAVEADPLVAAAAGLALFGVAAERAGAKAAGPGTFAPHLLDALAGLTPADIERGVRLC